MTHPGTGLTLEEVERIRPFFIAGTGIVNPSTGTEHGSC